MAFFAAMIPYLHSSDREIEPSWCRSDQAVSMAERNIQQSIDIDDLPALIAEGQVLLFAHRGGFMCEEAFQAPENSIANIEKAVRIGFDGFEADVWKTRDGEFVVFHDSHLARRSNGDGRITNFTLDELRKLNLKMPSGELTREKIPTLKEFLAIGRGRIIFLLQIKENIVEDFPEIYRAVKTAGADKSVLYWVKATKENVDAFSEFAKAGFGDIPRTVVWRADEIEKLDYLISKIGPRMVDFTPTFPEGWGENKVNILFPSEHYAFVIAGKARPVTPMVSRMKTRSYMDLLHAQGVRIFASHSAELQLYQLVEQGLHK